MMNNYIALLPEIILVGGIILMTMVRVFRSANTPKTFYTLSKYIIISAATLTIVLYNKSYSDGYINSLFTTLFKTIIYVFTLGWSYLSCKRFQYKNKSSYGFYLILMFNLLGFSIALSSLNLGIVGGVLSSVFILNYLLLNIDMNNDENRFGLRYLGISIFFIIIFIGSAGLLKQVIGNLDFYTIDSFLTMEKDPLWYVSLSVALVLCVFLFMMAASPFHFWYSDVVGNAILPVSGYISIIPVFAYFGCLVNLIVNGFYPIYTQWFYYVMLTFGAMSVFIGAIGANSEKNLRKIFSGSSLYCVGVLLLTISEINNQSLLSAFIYLLVYSLAIFGVYTVFYGFKVKGEYLYNVDDIKGISTQRPYISAAILVFMISIIGTPPFLGFLGKLSVINNLVLEGAYFEMMVILFSMLILVYAFLNIITKMYFEPRSNIFDSVDQGVYLVLAINLILIVISIVNPKYLMSDVEAMLVAVF